ncbi:MAG: MBL fold metallo-hydrolase [Verrucomicrobia bacterium]|nr:MBL fold metallo-hydrolase [Verrucomicrobiota bacterium]
MSNEELYLKQNVLMEPLVDQWYAWAHLISPATAAMNICERHLRIMNSYIESPDVHESAVKNPKMLGGPFVDYKRKRVDEMKELKERTLRERAQMLALAQAIKDLDTMLRTEPDGFSLEPFYQKVPEMLRGYVELLYDLNNRASFRFIEPLLYQSDFYDDSTQSLMFSLVLHDHRPFVLSTPRLGDPEDVHLRIPFKSPGLDELFKMKREPQSYSFIKDALGIPDGSDGRFRQFFTPETPVPYKVYEGPTARWRYFGHACILVETPTTTVLLDPMLSYVYEAEVPRYTYADLPEVIDYALITHNHQDHILFETILQLRHKIRHIVVPRNGNGALQDPSLRLLLQQIGFKNVIELAELESIPTKSGSILGVPFLGEHADLNIHTKLAYRVDVDGHTLLFAADSCNIEPALYRHFAKLYGGVEVLFLGMECDGAPMSWVYGALHTQPIDRKKDRTRRLAGSNYERGMAIIDELKPKEVYVYAMGQEPWLSYITSIKYTDESNPIIASNKLIAECRQRGLASERLFGEREMFLT